MKNPRPRFLSAPELWSKLAPEARRMPGDSTPAEDHLWQALRRGGLGGLKFRRQRASGPFIVDLYCVRSQVVLEIDGSIHKSHEQTAADGERQAYLEGLGLTVLRFTNDEVCETWRMCSNGWRR